MNNEASVSDVAPRRVKRSRAARARTQTERLEAPERPLHETIRPLLVELAYMRRREHMPPADVLFEHTRSQLNKLRAKLVELGLPQADVTDIYYALVAFVDETMQADRGALQDFWQAHLLQLELFGETRAGEGFYERLSRAQAERKLFVVRVYYVCLLFGFRGIYAQHGELERENLIEQVRQTLGIAAEDALPLSPFGERPDEPAADGRRSRILQWLASSAALLAVIWYLGISFSVNAQGRALTQALSQAADRMAGATGQTPTR